MGLLLSHIILAKHYNDSCIESEQCKPLLGEKASCIESKCSCKEGKFFNEGRCNDKKELNEQCMNNAECYVASDPETVECRNGVCSCKFNYTRDSLQNRCRPREKSKKNKTKIIFGIIIYITFFIFRFFQHCESTESYNNTFNCISDNACCIGN